MQLRNTLQLLIYSTSALCILLFAVLAGCGDQETEDPVPFDSCADVDCSAAPPSECVDDDNLLVFESPGTCEEGRCSFESTEQVCDFGCDEGACLPDPCTDDIECTNPPSSAECNVSEGICVDGGCVYESANEGESCDDGNLCTTGSTCEAGTCTSGTPLDCSALDWHLYERHL